MERRAVRRAQAGAIHLDPAVRSHLGGHQHATRAELSRARRPLYRAPQRLIDWCHGAGKARLSLARNGYDRNGAHATRAFPALCFPRGAQAGWFRGSADLLQAPRAADLAWPDCHGNGWGAVSLGSALARRSSEAGAQQDGPCPGGVGATCVGPRLWSRCFVSGCSRPRLCSPTKSSPIRSSRRGHARSPRSCVAWSAKINRSTTRTRRLLATCACSSESVCRPAIRSPFQATYAPQQSVPLFHHLVCAASGVPSALAVLMLITPTE
jgi:hypothetical protein